MKSILFILVSGLLPQLSWAQVQPIDEVFEPKEVYDPERFEKVAVIQWNPGPSPVPATNEVAFETKMRNAHALTNYISEAAGKGAKFVIVPEFTVVGYPDFPDVPAEEDNFRSREDIQPYVEAVPGPTTDYFASLAKHLGISIQFGMAEVDPQTNKYYNAAVIVTPQGEVAGRHRKVHLFEHESNYLSAGDSATIIDSPYGKIGIIICSDVYDNLVLSQMKKAGVNVITLSTSWARMNSGMSQFRSSARAVGSFMLAANHTYFPDSGVINPDGTTQSHIRQSGGVAYGYIPKVGNGSAQKRSQRRF